MPVCPTPRVLSAWLPNAMYLLFLTCRRMFVFPLFKRNFRVVVVVEGCPRCGQLAYPLTYQLLASRTRLWARLPQA